MDRILLGQLGANGDCLYATILARQLRKDFPGAEITWAISSQCSHLLANNPDVDKIWEIEVAGWNQHEMMWRVFEREALRCYVRREFDAVFLSQIWPNNFHRYDGTVRPSILRAYGRPITVPIENVIRLTDDEIGRVEDFARQERLREFEHRILFECSAKSGQSFLTPALAQEITAHLHGILPGACVIFSTHLPMELNDPRSRYAGTLTLREIAHLTHHATLFVGAGSGGTVAASSTASKRLPMVQLLSASTSVLASFAHDFEYFGLTERPVLELTDEDPATIAHCIAAVCTLGVDAAMQKLGGRIPVHFDHYFSSIDLCLLSRNQYLDAARSLLTTADRYGWTKELIDFGRKRIDPRLTVDPSWLFAPGRAVAEQFRATLAAGEAAPAVEPVQRRWRHSLASESVGG